MLQRAIERQKEQMVSQIERRMGERREVSESGGAVPASPAGGGGFSGVPEESRVPGGEGIPGGAPTEGGL